MHRAAVSRTACDNARGWLKEEQHLLQVGLGEVELGGVKRLADLAETSEACWRHQRTNTGDTFMDALSLSRDQIPLRIIIRCLFPH